MVNLVHGGDIYGAVDGEYLMWRDFSVNTNPVAKGYMIRDWITKELLSCHVYPDPLCRRLRKGISEYENIPSEHIICGNGAADLIFRLALAVKPKKALVLAPTFSEYEKALKVVDCEVDHYMLEESNDFIVDENFIEYLEKDRYDMIFLCNPNNPTGQLTSKEMLEKILESVEKTKGLLVLDECFIEFVEGYKNISLVSRVESSKSLFLLKAFTKIFSIPGIRLGYGMCSDEKLLERLYEVAQAWSVSTVAQSAGMAALASEEIRTEAVEVVKYERNRLVSAFNRLEIKNYPSYANYILINMKNNPYFEAECFKNDLRNKGILIRDCSNYIGLEKGYYRIAVKDSDHNIYLIMKLEEMKQTKGINS